MTIRTTSKTVTFAQVVDLDGVGPIPPGTYRVDTDEELIETASFQAYRRVATMIHLTNGGATQVFVIDPTDLEASMMRDAGLTIVPPGNG